MSEYKELKRLAELATPQDFDSAQAASEGGWIECPCCGGEGSVEIGIDYLNYDDVAQGVQFYGVGEEHVNTEAYYRAAKPAAVLALIADRDALAAQRDEGLAREAELQKEVARMTSAYQAERARRTEARAQNDALRQRLAEAEKLLTACEGALLSWGHSASGITKFLACPGCADGEQPS